MTYLTFHLVFIIPAILLLGFTQRRALGGAEGRRAYMAVSLTCAVALVYTTPWDNYLVYRGVWSYGADRVLGTIGYVPIEEYLFFILQPVLTGLLLLRMLETAPTDKKAPATAARWVGLAVYGAASAFGWWLLLRGSDEGLYLGLILAWAGPVLFALWAVAGAHYWRHRRAFFVTTLASTLYLWIADAIAIRLGIWEIAERYTFGIAPLGLPIEEATFFLVTNLLVVQGVILFLDGHKVFGARSHSVT